MICFSLTYHWFVPFLVATIAASVLPPAIGVLPDATFLAHHAEVFVAWLLRLREDCSVSVLVVGAQLIRTHFAVVLPWIVP